MTVKKQKPHHHGDLRKALIEAGLEILSEGGLEGLTLRKCAARAGVSHAAPAHHFGGLKGLRTAIATHGYAIFERMMREGIEAAEPNRRSQALGMSLGYIRFATEHNALFNLIFDNPDKFDADPEWQAAAISARKVLVDASTHFVPGDGGDAATEVALWAFVHGYAKLIEIGRVSPGSGDGRDVKFEDIFAYLDLQVKDGDPKP